MLLLYLPILLSLTNIFQAPVVQWIEFWASNSAVWVQIPPGPGKCLLYAQRLQMTLYSLLSLNITLFIISLWGLFVIRKNLLVILIALELLALSVNLNFLAFSSYLDDITGQIFSILILTVIGSESAIGLALLLSVYRLKQDISVDIINSLKG